MSDLKKRAEERRKIIKVKHAEDEGFHLGLDMLDRFVTAVERIAEALERK